VRQILTKLRAAMGAATVVAFVSPAAAQGPPRAGPGSRVSLPARLAERAQALSLNDDQTARLRTIAQWMERSDSSLRGQVRAAMSGGTSRELNAEQRYQLMKQVRPIMDQVRANRLAALDSVHAVLTAEQWQKLGERQMRMRAWGRRPMGGFARGRFRFRGGPWGLWWGWRRPG
jgi:hypothetical protein